MNMSIGPLTVLSVLVPLAFSVISLNIFKTMYVKSDSSFQLYCGFFDQFIHANFREFCQAQSKTP